MSVDKGDLDGCSFLCEENSQCKWYTYDNENNQCYLKSSRGQLVKLADGRRYSSGSILDDG